MSSGSASCTVAIRMRPADSHKQRTVQYGFQIVCHSIPVVCSERRPDRASRAAVRGLPQMSLSGTTQSQPRSIRVLTFSTRSRIRSHVCDPSVFLTCSSVRSRACRCVHCLVTRACFEGGFVTRPDNVLDRYLVPLARSLCYLTVWIRVRVAEDSRDGQETVKRLFTPRL